MDLPREVLNGRVRDADTVLTDDPFIKEKLPVADDPELYDHSLGHKNINCTPRQLAKRSYHWYMKGGPDVKNPILCEKTGMMKPDLSKISCMTFGNNKKKKSDTRPKKKKKSNDEGEKECLCCKNIRAIMRTDLVLLCKGGNVKDHPNAERIHKARWIGFLTKLLEKFQRIPQFGDEESLFAFLSVSTPYASAAKQNAAHDYIFQANGITIKGCHYLPCEMLGHHHTYRRFSDFQSNFLSGLAQGASKYVRLLYSQQKQNSLIWFAMIGISIERKGWPDFTPCTVSDADNQSTTKIVKYLEKERSEERR